METNKTNILKVLDAPPPLHSLPFLSFPINPWLCLGVHAPQEFLYKNDANPFWSPFAPEGIRMGGRKLQSGFASILHKN